MCTVGSRFLRGRVVACFAAACTVVIPAHASFMFNNTFDSSITGLSNAGAVETAIMNAEMIYTTTFIDPITVNLTFSNMSGGLGMSNTSFENVDYSTFCSALKTDGNSANDASANASLGSCGSPGTATNPVNGSTTINVKTANLRAVGLPGSVGSDSTVSINFVQTTIDGGVYDTTAVLQHEIDEALGLGSSLPNTPFSTIFPEDLFRYSAPGVRSFTTNSTATAFFSINGGTGLLAQFDNQNDGGDFGDWQSNPLPNSVGPQVQDAFGTPGSHPVLGVELTALDVIGYTTAVPEPGTMALFGIGWAGLAYWRRRRA
jgi:hypothetical protein